MEAVAATAVTQGVLTLVATFAGLAWGMVQKTKWYRAAQERNLAVVESAVETAVHQVYESYTAELKAAAADGKLTRDECRAARQNAVSLAVDLCRAQGVDALKTVGAATLPLLIEKALAGLKATGVVK